MKSYTLATLALVLVSFLPPVQAQWAQTNSLRDRESTRLTNVGTNVPQGIPREFLGAPSMHRLRTEFVNGLDSLRMKGPSYPFPNDGFIPNGTQISSLPALAKLSPQSQFSVIDTAIVRSTTDTTRHVYSFDAKAKMTSDLEHKWTGDFWVNAGRTTYTYDVNGIMLTRFGEQWSNGQWANGYRNTHTYDADGNRLSWLYEQWSNGQLVYGERETSTYDANGNVLSWLDELWSNGQWVVGSRGTGTYDADNHPLFYFTEQWSNGQWVNSWRETWIYDANGNSLSWLDEHWSNGQWVNSWRETRTYDANGNRLSRLDEEWSNGQWMNMYRDTSTYDANKNMTTRSYEYWSNGQWVNGSRDTWIYDANGNSLSWLDELWSNGQWMNLYRDTCTYDAQENLTSVWCYAWLNSSWTPADRGNGYFDFSVTDSAGNSYVLRRGHNYTFIHKLIVTGVASESGGGPAPYSLSQNYPNPFNPTTVISYQLPAASNVRLIVYDMIGREVSVLVNERKEPGNYTAQFNGSGLSSGVYFYRIEAGSFVETRKLVLIK